MTSWKARTPPVRHPTLRVLLVPVDPDPAEVLTMADSSPALSDAMGGHPFDDTTTGRLPDGTRFTMYLPDPPDEPLPENPRAAALAARLGLLDRCVQARIRGTVLFTGLSPDTCRDLDVPDALVAVARQTGLAVAPTSSRTECGYRAADFGL